VVEANPIAGGLARSVTDSAGFTWDLGGHVHFSRFDYYNQLLDSVLENRWIWHDRAACVRMGGRFVPYPIQRNRELLPAKTGGPSPGHGDSRPERPSVRPENFRDWLTASFEPSLCQSFFFPYNQKIWGVPLEEMSFTWVAERVAKQRTEELRQATGHSGKSDDRWGPNHRFRYPESGGTGSLWAAVAAGIQPTRIEFGRSVISIDPIRKTIAFSSGDRLEYETLISSAPLNWLCSLLTNELPGLEVASRDLRSNRVLIVGLGLEGDPPDEWSDKNWIYFPSPGVPFYRATLLSGYSPSMVPPGGNAWSILAEICLDWCAQPPAEVPGRVIEAFRAESCIHSRHKIRSVWSQELSQGYPIPTLSRDQALGRIQPVLEMAGIFSRGRFGGWKYEVANQDHSFMQGVEVVDRLLLGKPETAYGWR
jgi:UDP-galactopyranose mutase